MKRFFRSLYFLVLLFITLQLYAQNNYQNYHAEIIKCEQLIVKGDYSSAIQKFDSLFDKYDFVFLRDIKVATQLSNYEKDYQSCFKFIRLGITSGWNIKHIKKSKNLLPLKNQPEWSNIELKYDSLHRIFQSKLDFEISEQVHQMFKNDQKKALGAFLKIGDKARSRYSERKFAPQSEKHLLKLDSILDEFGYPGEKLIGNRLWASVLFSHHNSISLEYNSKDTLYNHVRPKLINALQEGEISLYDFAHIQDWKTIATKGYDSTSFGFIGSIANENQLKLVNQNRGKIGMRSVELRNSLIEVEEATGLNLYLPKGWQTGKILMKNN